MHQNFMQYVDDDCMNLFTQDQKERIRAVLETAPRRMELLTSDVERILVTGIQDLAAGPPRIYQASYQLEITMPSGRLYGVKLLDVTGRTLTEKTGFDTSNGSVSLPSIPSQVVIVLLTTSEGVFSKKMLIR
jgi:hypothetical protein